METYTTAQAAKLLKCSPDQVRALILDRQLVASNIGRGTQRARWVITDAALLDFMTTRQNMPSGNSERKAKRKAKPAKPAREWV